MRCVNKNSQRCQSSQHYQCSPCWFSPHAQIPTRDINSLRTTDSAKQSSSNLFSLFNFKIKTATTRQEEARRKLDFVFTSFINYFRKRVSEAGQSEDGALIINQNTSLNLQVKVKINEISFSINFAQIQLELCPLYRYLCNPKHRDLSSLVASVQDMIHSYNDIVWVYHINLICA